jgi:hypothetical protein
MNSKEVATAVVICTVRPIVCCLSKLELTSGLEGVKVWYTPVVLLFYDCVMLVCLAMSAYLRTRGHQAAVSAEVGTQSSLEDSMCDRHQGAQSAWPYANPCQARSCDDRASPREGVCKHVESICGF